MNFSLIYIYFSLNYYIIIFNIKIFFYIVYLGILNLKIHDFNFVFRFSHVYEARATLLLLALIK